MWRTETFSFLFIWITYLLSMAQTFAMEPVILIHGGAGDVSDDAVPARLAGVTEAAAAGSEVLLAGGSAMDAVIAAVKVMENLETFNAGKGAVLTTRGEVEMDAIVMDGTNLNVGAVGSVKYVEHPIELARLVMDNSPHAMMVGEGAMSFARENGVPFVPAYRFLTKERIDALEAFLNGSSYKEPGVGTVGAVALDINGHLAVATSTGGTTGKLPGRIGDTPLPGSGGYADDDVGAVSATGVGESILRVCLSHRIISSMRLGMSAGDASTEALNYMANKVGETAGVITLSKTGDIGIKFISKRMAWAYRRGEGEIRQGVDQSTLKNRIDL